MHPLLIFCKKKPFRETNGNPQGNLPSRAVEWVGALLHLVYEQGVHCRAREVRPVGPQPEQYAVHGLQKIKKMCRGKSTESSGLPSAFPLFPFPSAGPPHSSTSAGVARSLTSACSRLSGRSRLPRMNKSGFFLFFLGFPLRFPYLRFSLHILQRVCLFGEEVLDPALPILYGVEVSLEFAEADDCGEKSRNP